MNIHLIISLAVSVVLVGWAFWAVAPRTDSVTSGSAPTASIVEGVQYIDISAKGGYSPRIVSAKAGVPTTLRVATRGTFDCSASLVIPALSYQKFLPASGVEEIQIPAEKAQGTLQGLCSMGMYSFKVVFE